MATKQKDNSLATVLALAGLAQSQQHQGDEAQAQRVHAALQMLGLMNQQQQDQAAQAHATELLGLQRENFQGEARHRDTADVLAQKQADMANWEAVDRSTRGYEANANEVAKQKATEGQFWSGTLPLEYDRNVRLENAQKQQADIARIDAITKAYGSGLPVNPALASYLGHVDPRLAQSQTEVQQKAIADQIAKLSGSYNVADPKSRQILETGLPPEVVQGLRGSLPKQPTQSSPVAPTPSPTPALPSAPQAILQRGGIIPSDAPIYTNVINPIQAAFQQQALETQRRMANPPPQSAFEQFLTHLGIMR